MRAALVVVVAVRTATRRRSRRRRPKPRRTPRVVTRRAVVAVGVVIRVRAVQGVDAGVDRVCAGDCASSSGGPATTKPAIEVKNAAGVHDPVGDQAAPGKSVSIKQ